MRLILAIKGAEAKALGIHVQLGPVGGPLGKIPAVSVPSVRNSRCSRPARVVRSSRVW